MTHSDSYVALHDLDVAGMQVRRDEYTRLRGFREPLAGPKRDEALRTAVEAIAALQRVIELRDELLADTGGASVVAHAFASEIDRALKGQR